MIDVVPGGGSGSEEEEETDSDEDYDSDSENSGRSTEKCISLLFLLYMPLFFPGAVICILKIFIGCDSTIPTRDLPLPLVATRSLTITKNCGVILCYFQFRRIFV